MGTDFIAWGGTKQKEELKKLGLPYTSTYTADERERLLQLMIDEKKDRGDAEVEKIIKRAREYNIAASNKSRLKSEGKSPAAAVKPSGNKALDTLVQAQIAGKGEAKPNPTEPQQPTAEPKRFKVMPNGVLLHSDVCMCPPTLMDAGCWGCWAWRWCTYKKRNPQPKEPPRISGRSKEDMDQFRLTHENNMKEGPAPWPEANQ